MNEKWNAWDVPYFATPNPKPAPELVPQPEPVLPSDSREPRANVLAVGKLPLAGEGALHGDRVMAVLLGLGAVLGGFVVFGGLMLLSFIASFGSPPDPLVPAVFGFVVMVLGITLAVLAWRAASRPAEITMRPDGFELSFPTFKDPLFVSREMVRAVAIDDKPVVLFRNNARFEIAGTLPEHVFADQLDNRGRLPWEHFDPEQHKPRTAIPAPATVWGSLGSPPAHTAPPPPAAEVKEVPSGYKHDDPGADGWASGGPTAWPQLPKGPSHLWGPHGSSLPFAALAPGDVPNIAILLHEPHRTTKPPWWYDLSPLNARCNWRFRGGRPIRGILLKVRSSVAAEAAFAPWSVVRQITATDVVDEGLIVAKPLKGLRLAIYAGLFVLSAVVEIVIRYLK